MIRKVKPEDKEAYIAMSKAFYKSDAVMHDIPEEHFYRTFEELMSGSPYADAYIVEQDGKAVGYTLLAITYSNEAGGLVLWIEEIYILPEYRGKGYGTEIFEFLDKEYGNKVARIRLEVEETNSRAIRLYNKLGFKYLDYKQMYKESAENNTK